MFTLTQNSFYLHLHFARLHIIFYLLALTASDSLFSHFHCARINSVHDSKISYSVIYMFTMAHIAISHYTINMAECRDFSSFFKYFGTYGATTIIEKQPKSREEKTSFRLFVCSTCLFFLSLSMTFALDLLSI